MYQAIIQIGGQRLVYDYVYSVPFTGRWFTEVNVDEPQCKHGWKTVYVMNEIYHD